MPQPMLESPPVIPFSMTDARQKSFFDKMVAAKVVNAGIDYKKSYTLAFVCKGVGKDLAK